jgi:hypothetical protein
MSKEVRLFVYHRAAHSESIEQVYSQFVARMAKVAAPLLKDLPFPPTPDCGDGLDALYGFKHPKIEGVRFEGRYIFRGESYVYEDKARFDDLFSVLFTVPHKDIDYKAILLDTFPELIEAFSAYRAIVGFDNYDVKLTGLSSNRDPVYAEILKTGRDMNGRDNIFTLRPAQYWDETVCQKALGYGPDEVIARLEGKVPKVEKLLNGVYVVLNTDLELTLEQYREMNRQFKQILGLK